MKFASREVMHPKGFEFKSQDDELFWYFIFHTKLVVNW